MTRLGIDTAAVVASRRAAVKQDRMSIATRTVPHEHSPSSHAQTIDGPMSDVENFTNSPVTGFSHGLQRFTSNTSERPLSRVAEEGGERELENREADEISLGSDSELEEELEEEGLYAGSYSRLVALYSLAPITFLILFVVFALVPSLVQHDDWKGKYPYTPYLPFPIAELLVSGGAWSISYTVNDFIFRISVWICNSIHTFLFYCTNPPQHILPPLSVTPPILVSGLAYATLSIFLRLSTIPILLIPQGSLASSPTWHEPVFGRVWWAGLGWAVFEALAGIKQGYQGISLYRDVLIDISKLKKELEGSSLRNGPGIRGNDGSNTDFTNGGAENSDTANHTSRSSSLSTPMASPTFVRESQNHQESSGQAPSARDCLPRVTSNPERQPLLSGTVPSRSRESIGNPYLGSTPFAESMETEVERDLDQLIAIKKRDDLERVYGIPFIRIPAFISCLQRVNSLLLSMGYTLVLSAVYILSVSNGRVRGPLSPYPSPPSSPWFPSFSLSASSVPSSSSIPSVDYLKFVVPVLIILQFLIYVLHSEVALPRLGVHTVVYVGLLVSLGLFFVGLGLWDAVS